MIAVPSSPGVAIPVYQPAGKPRGGTSRVLSFFSPRAIRSESTPIAAICRRTGTDLARCAGVTTRGTGTTGLVGEADVATGFDAEADGVTATTVSPEQPAVPTAIVANNAPTAAITVERARRGPRFSTWCRTRPLFLRSGDDAYVLRRPPHHRPQRTPAQPPADPGGWSRRRLCCHHPLPEHRPEPLQQQQGWLRPRPPTLRCRPSWSR